MEPPDTPKVRTPEPLEYTALISGRTALLQSAGRYALAGASGLLVAAIVAGLVAIRFHHWASDQRRRAAAFDQKTSASVIIGKTPQQVIAVFGTPQYDSDNDAPGTWHPSDEQRVMLYEDGTGETARVVINGGIAASVDHYNK